MYTNIKSCSLPFHRAEKSSSDLWATYSLQWCKPWGSNLPRVPHPPLAHASASLSLNLLFHLELSSTWVEQCSLRPPFYLSFQRNITFPAPLLSVRMKPYLSIFETDWNHNSSRGHLFSTPPCLFFCFNWNKSLFLIIKELPILATLVSSENCQKTSFYIPSAQMDSLTPRFRQWWLLSTKTLGFKAYCIPFKFLFSSPAIELKVLTQQEHPSNS